MPTRYHVPEIFSAMLMGLITRRSHQPRKSNIRKSSQFLVLILLLARLSPVTNSPLNTVITFTLYRMRQQNPDKQTVYYNNCFLVKKLKLYKKRVKLHINDDLTNFDVLDYVIKDMSLIKRMPESRPNSDG